MNVVYSLYFDSTDSALSLLEAGKLLVQTGADQSIDDSNGATPIAHAISNGYEQLVWLFLSRQYQ